MSKKKSSKQDLDLDHLWDEGNTGPVPFDLKYQEWVGRDWDVWLAKYLSFPFTVNREEDLDSFGEADNDDPFRVGAIFQVTGITFDDGTEWFYASVVAPDGEEADVPLADLEVRPKTDPNYWPLREYAVWAANM